MIYTRFSEQGEKTRLNQAWSERVGVNSSFNQVVKKCNLQFLQSKPNVVSLLYFFLANCPEPNNLI